MTDLMDKWKTVLDRWDAAPWAMKEALAVAEEFVAENERLKSEIKLLRHQRCTGCGNFLRHPKSGRCPGCS